MREIKFRAWDKVKKQMWEPRQIGWGHNGEQGGFPIVERWDGNVRLGSIHGDDCVLMQFTGLRDKDGKEIYEGDIIEYDDCGEKVREAVFLNDYTDCCVSGIGYGFGKQGAPMTSDEVEVIGNVHENPELLK